MSRWITVSTESAAQILGVSKRRVLRLLEEKKLAGVVTGHDGKWRVRYEPLIRYMVSRKKEEGSSK